MRAADVALGRMLPPRELAQLEARVQALEPAGAIRGDFGQEAGERVRPSWQARGSTSQSCCPAPAAYEISAFADEELEELAALAETAAAAGGEPAWSEAELAVLEAKLTAATREGR
jgi:hypothetical protein